MPANTPLDQRHGVVDSHLRTNALGMRALVTKLPEALGFREEPSSVHTSRTMMFNELSLAFDHVGQNAKQADYVAAIVEHNILGKRTQTTRIRSAQRLTELYSLDPGNPIFRLLRSFWAADEAAHRGLAFLTATTRDPVLRNMTPTVLAAAIGAPVTVAEIVDRLKHRYPSRFKLTTLLSTAQNLASSWAQAGYLTGKIKKTRTRAVVTPVLLTHALVIGYLSGARGKVLLDTLWTRMLDRTPAEIGDLASEASKQGWMNYKAVGSVVEITFPGLLTPQEEKASQ
jgi:hypothetical protein